MINTNYLPDFSVEGKVALVTGAARGIGRACALTLAAAGADLALGLKNIDRDEGLEAEISSMGRKVLRLQMDISQIGEIRAATALTIKHFGRIDILVNNAGIAPANPAENVTEADYDETVNVNLRGT